MRLECLEFKRCCFCLPLRYGLLVSGYLKMAVLLFMFVSVVFDIILFMSHVKMNLHVVPPVTTALVLYGILISVLLADTALTIVFLIGGHKKDVKLLKVYNYYSIGIFVLFALAFLLFHGAEMYHMVPRLGLLHSAILMRSSISAGLLNLGFQIYLILLTRSEISKLETNCQFRFVNHADEARCTLDEGGHTVEVYVKNNETVDQSEIVSENEVKEQTEGKQNGNYVKLIN